MSEAELATRDRILLAAREEFLEKGYQGAWLRDISQKAGVTTGALYGYFKSKEDLFGALVDTEYNHILELYDQILKEFHALPARQQAEQMQTYTWQGMRQMADYIYEHWSAFQLILCHAEDTKYSHLIEEMAAQDIQATNDFGRVTKESGFPIKPVNAALGQMLTNSMFSIFFSMVHQNLPRGESDAYIRQLLDFFTAGWQKIMGF